MRKQKDSRRVYSTEVGRTCPGCLRAVADCVCKTPHATLSAVSRGDGVVRLHRETKGRKGKGVTLVKGLALPDAEIAALAKTLKARCGVGGAVKKNLKESTRESVQESVQESVIELQTADREKVKQILEEFGHDVRLAGG